MSTFFVTGAGGFLGQRLVPALHSALEGRVRTVGLAGRDLTFDDLAKKSLGGGALIHLAGLAHDLERRATEDDYERVNVTLTRSTFDAFVQSDLDTFVFMSSIAAVCEDARTPVTEESPTFPRSAYGRSKRAAEVYLQEAELPAGKRLLILRPVMIHGPGNKGNLNLLYGAVRRGWPYPLGAFSNFRSLLGADNACFLICELLRKSDASGVFHLSDDHALSTVDVVRIIAEEAGRSPRILNVPRPAVRFGAMIGGLAPRFPLDGERLNKLTTSLVAPNDRVKEVLGIGSLPVAAEDGLRVTIASMKNADSRTPNVPWGY